MIAGGLLGLVDSHCVWLWCFRMEKYKKIFPENHEKILLLRKNAYLCIPKTKDGGFV